MIRPLFPKVYSFTVYKVFNELAKTRSSVEPILYKSCLCSATDQYFESKINNQDDKDALKELEEASDILKNNDDSEEDEDWETDCEDDDDDDNCTVIATTGDEIKIIEKSSKKKLTIVDVGSNATIIQVANELIDLHNSLKSNQEKKNLNYKLRRVMVEVESGRTEKVLPPRRKISVRGRPKNVMRQKIHYERTLKKEKEDAKEAVEEEKKAVRQIEKKVEMLQDEENRSLTVRKRKASAMMYGKEDFVFDRHFKAHKRSRGVIPNSLESVLSSAIKKDEITEYLDPKPDGNCGFRAIAFSVERNDRAYHDEDQYLETCKSNQESMNKSDLAEWFYDPDCAQLTAETYGISMCVYPSLENEHTVVNPPLTFLPLELPKNKSKPVAIHLQNNHNMHWVSLGKSGVDKRFWGALREIWSGRWSGHLGCPYPTLFYRRFKLTKI
ncbi:hypothetical protein EDC96DRAFT_590533 [Choanephora cucurbitarum]|nr:hypothetical protein EDC96DRAFT_590533 [Choanephora cucurbitarum]